MSEGAWWDVFAGTDAGLADLETWLGGVDAASRVRIRERIAESGYETVLDCGAGLGLDFFGIQANLAHPVQYTGLEPSEQMRQAAQQAADAYRVDEVPLVAGSIEKIPFPDASFDLVYCRHVLEHLPSFEWGLGEMLRVARLEALVVFFMRPGAEPYLLRERDGLWQNRYSKADIDAVVAAHPRMEVAFWETLGTEVLLHVLMEDTVQVDAARVRERLR